MAKLKFGCVQGGFAPVRYGKEFFYSGCRDTEIRAPSSPVLHKRFHSCHVVIRAARLERAAMTSAALCNPLPSKCVITDGLTRDTGNPFCQRVCVHTSEHTRADRGICMCCVCMHANECLLHDCLLMCMCNCVDVYKHTDIFMPCTGSSRYICAWDHMGPPTQVPTPPDLCSA